MPKDAVCFYIEMSNDAKALKVMPKNSYLYGVEKYEHSGDGETVAEKAGFTVKALVKFVESKFNAK